MVFVDCDLWFLGGGCCWVDYGYEGYIFWLVGLGWCWDVCGNVVFMNVIDEEFYLVCVLVYFEGVGWIFSYVGKLKFSDFVVIGDCVVKVVVF